MSSEPLMTRLNNGVEVTAKVYYDRLCAITYANRTQAEKAASRLGAGWTVFHFSRPFYVGREGVQA